MAACSFDRRVPPSLFPPVSASAAPNCGGGLRSPANSPIWPAARIRRLGPGSTSHTTTSHTLTLRGLDTFSPLRGQHGVNSSGAYCPHSYLCRGATTQAGNEASAEFCGELLYSNHRSQASSHGRGTSKVQPPTCATIGPFRTGSTVLTHATLMASDVKSCCGLDHHRKA